MNLESLQKDVTIIAMLRQLGNRLGIDKFVLNDYWDIDLCAIGISDFNKRFLVYISTYDLEEGQYYVELENLNHENETNYETVGKYKDVDILELEKLTISHLRIENIIADQTQ